MIPNNLGFHQDYQLVVFQANYLDYKKLFTFLKLIFYQENKIKFLSVELVSIFIGKLQPFSSRPL